jgi:hypothetical protein
VTLAPEPRSRPSTTGGARLANVRFGLPPRWSRRLATAFTLFHLAAVLSFVLPGDMSAFRATLREKLFDRYLYFTGAWQYWNFFAPEPQDTVFEVEVQARYRDGSVVVWQLPGPEDRPVLQRYAMERQRKWRELLRNDDWSAIRPDAARFALRHFLESNPEVPEQMLFVRRWRTIPPPREGDFQPQEALDLDHEYVFYRWPEAP